MLERLHFSIPISVAINAPADLVWDALTDIESYPATFDAVLAARPRYPCGSVSTNGSSRNQHGVTLSSSTADHTSALKGSTWNITRLSVIENQKYSAQVTITRCNHEDDKKSFTMSTHQMLGAACSLKLSVVPVKGPPKNDLNDSHKNDIPDTQVAKMPSLSQRPSPETNTTTSSSPECCQVTAIMTSKSAPTIYLKA